MEKKPPRWINDFVITEEVHLKLRCLLVHFTGKHLHMQQKNQNTPPQKTKIKTNKQKRTLSGAKRL